jgi:hydroxylamine dehydrogenase
MRSAISFYSTTITLLAATVLWTPDTAFAQRPAKTTPQRAAWGSPEGAKCLQCHKAMNPALAEEWHDSAHGQKGINCYDCHKANKNDLGAFEHNGSVIHVIVSPKDCGACHQKEVDQQKGSHHAKAGEILASLDNFLGSVLGGPPAVAVGCFQCHGSTVKVLPNGKFDPATWPNTGIGRINPDGSAGSCSACHTRHRFSKAQAREPQTCGKCHLGPDHPQMEVYQESKHGILWEVNKLRLNIDKSPWRAGVEYTAAPSCATCHMSATRAQGVTHDVGERISWTLRPAVSTKLNMVVFDDLSKEDRPDGVALPKVGDEVKGRDGVMRKVQQILTWQQRREKMQDVCTACHANGQVFGFYQQFDDLVLLYNDKFGKPAAAIMAELYKANKLTPAPMDEKLEWIYYELWHHQGRRARHGASMSGPDYAWWHGIYEVAKSFYMEFLPEMKLVAGEPLASDLMEKYVYTQPGHLWLKEGMTKEQLQRIEEFYRNRYGEQGDKK